MTPLLLKPTDARGNVVTVVSTFSSVIKEPAAVNSHDSQISTKVVKSLYFVRLILGELATAESLIRITWEGVVVG